MVDLLNGEKPKKYNWDKKTSDQSDEKSEDEGQDSFDEQSKNNKKDGHKSKKKQKKQEIPSVSDISVQKADINKYKDPTGMSMRKLHLGLWFVENRKSMITLGYGLLIIVGVVTWSIFFYNFGHYFIFGMRQDQVLVNELINTSTVGHEFIINKSARDIELEKVEVLSLGSGKYDLVTMAANPNTQHWGSFSYYYVIGDKEYGKRETFILPGEVKYLPALGIEPGSGIANDARLVLSDLRWTRVSRHVYPDWQSYRDDRLNITSSDVSYTPAKATNLSEKLNLNELKFTVANNTAFNFWQVDFLILLYNRNRIIGVNKYVLDEFWSEETRDIRTTWPGTLSAVHDVVIIPEINILRDDIYMKFEGGTPSIR